MNIQEIVKEIEKEKGKPCEVTLKIIGEKSEEEVYGNLKERKCMITPIYNGDDEELKEDAEKLKGNYENLDAVKERIRLLGFESYSRKEDERKVVSEIEKKADKLSRKKTLCGSMTLFGLLLGRKGLFNKVKNVKEETEKQHIKQLEKFLKDNVGIFIDSDEKRRLMKEEFRKNNLSFLNHSYIVQYDGIHLHTQDLHPGFMIGIGDKIAKIDYDFLNNN